MILTCFISLCTTSCTRYFWNAKIRMKCQGRYDIWYTTYVHVGGTSCSRQCLHWKRKWKQYWCADLQYLSVFFNSFCIFFSVFCLDYQMAQLPFMIWWIELGMWNTRARWCVKLTEKIATDIIQVYNLCAGTHLTQAYLQPVVQTNFLKFGIQTILWLVILVHVCKMYIK